MSGSQFEEINGSLYVGRMKIGETIHELRTALGLSLEQVAAKVGVPYQQIWRYEQQDHIDARRLLQIAAALHAPLSQFLGAEVAELEGAAGLTPAELELRDLYREAKAEEQPELLQLLELLQRDQDGLRLVRLYRLLGDAPRRRLLGLAMGVATESGLDVAEALAPPKAEAK